MNKYFGFIDVSKVGIVNYPTEELKSMGYKLVFESNKKNPDFLRYIEYTEAEGKKILIVKLDLIDKQNKGLVHVWVRDSLDFLNSKQRRLLFNVNVCG